MAADGQPGRLGPRHELALRTLAALRRHRGDDVRQRLGVRRRARPRRAAHVGRASRRHVGGHPSGGSRASSRCRRVSVWVRRSSPTSPAAARASASASPIPASAAATGSGWSIIWRQALASASRWPARLPLSTDETYAGSSGGGRACRTSCRGGRGTARAGRSWRASPRGAPPSRCVPIQPKSRAVTVASRYIPMFVGDVRWATTGVGIVLEVVGRQAVVLRTDEGLEEPPGPARR